MKDLSEMFKKAQEMQAKMASMQDELSAVEVTGEAGGGLVKVTLNGEGAMVRLELDDSLFTSEDREVVEDLIVAAHKSAKEKVVAATQEKMKALTGGLSLPPGFKMPF